VTLARRWPNWPVARALAGAKHPGALAYLEAHIEQGPVLEAEGLALGVVTGIAAQLRYGVVVRGLAGHAGTCAMPLRRDALAGAAEMILAVEKHRARRCQRSGRHGGPIEALPGAANVIPDGAFHHRRAFGRCGRRDRAGERSSMRRMPLPRRALWIGVELIHDLPASPAMRADGLLEGAGATGTRRGGWCRARGMMR
jgi:allantoate deiminase